MNFCSLPVAVRAIADCFCVENRIVEEWLVRDYAGLVRQMLADATGKPLLAVTATE